MLRAVCLEYIAVHCLFTWPDFMYWWRKVEVKEKFSDINREKEKAK